LVASSEGDNIGLEKLSKYSAMKNSSLRAQKRKSTVYTPSRSVFERLNTFPGPLTLFV
jgi:hypothetical protein